jgi:hypothetical protein
MLSALLAIVAVACVVSKFIAFSYAIDLAEKLERVEAELEEYRRRNPKPSRHLKLVKGGSIEQRH